MYILHNRLSLLSLLLLASLATMAQTTTTNAATTKRDSLKPQKHIGDETILLQGITVMGRNEARQLRESGMPVSVMTSKELQGTASSMNDVLARVAGVTIRNTGGVGSASRLSVRGLEGKRLGLFVDETAMNQFSNFITLNDIPTDMIARIEIYKGIVPYKFGGSALGGAINVVTKEYPPIYFDASYEIGSFNTHRLNTVFKRTYAPSGLQFGMGGFFTYSANNYYMTLHNLGDLRVRRNHDAFRKGVIAGSIKATKWWFDELKAELIYTATHQQLQGIDLDVREAYTHSQAIATSLKAKRETFFIDGLAFDFEAAFDIGNYGVSDYAKTVYDWFGNSRPSQSPLGGETSTHPYDGHNKNLDGTGKLNLNYTINRHHSLNLNLYEAYTKLKPHDELIDAAYGFSLPDFPTTSSYSAIAFKAHSPSAAITIIRPPSNSPPSMYQHPSKCASPNTPSDGTNPCVIVSPPNLCSKRRIAMKCAFPAMRNLSATAIPSCLPQRSNPSMCDPATSAHSIGAR